MGKKKKKGSGLGLVLLAALLVAGGGFWFMQRQESSRDKASEHQPAVFEEKPKTGKLKTYTAEQFRDLYNNFAYPNTERISDDTPITGDPAADAHIRKIAVDRGYTLRSAPVTNTFRTVGDNFMLQERAAQPWLDMKVAAMKAGHEFALTAAYRSAEEQLQIFTERLDAANIPVRSIPTGRYDAKLIEVLSMTAVPGYSRHHSGYTVDIECKTDEGKMFHLSQCFDWLSANNYENAKKFGWIPSYPEGVGLQGPEPEAWEYVWVGIDTVTE